MNFRTARILVPVLVLTACTGQITGGLSSGGGAGAGPLTPGSGGANSSPGGGGQGALDCTTAHASAVRARLLSASQYTNTVQDLWKVKTDAAKDFGGAVFAQLTDVDVEHRANAASAIAHDAATNLANWAPCVPPAVPAATCEQQLIDQVGANAYRHPLSIDEKTQLTALFDAGVKEKDFATGVEWMMTGLIQSPDFLYQLAKPSATEHPGQVLPLSPYEYVSRLSFFMWDSTPDAMLYASAAAGDFADPGKLQAQVTRMVQDTRFSRGVEGFFSTWLRLNAFHEVARDAVGANGTPFDDAVVKALAVSLLKSATQVYATGQANISSLFEGSTYYFNDTLRKYYGLPGTGTDYTPMPMTGEDRRGILTHPALLALLARPKESFPIARGLFVRRTLLCQDISLPVGITVPQLPPIADGVSTRDRLEAHVRDPFCKSCHSAIDPPGYALEGFDEVGRFRAMDHGKAVNSSGTMTGAADLDGDFSKGDQLLAKLSNSTAIKTCFAQQYLQYAVARGIESGDTCSVDALGKGFAPSGDLKQLVVAIAGSDTFRLRLSEGVGP